jgi:tetraprenyl-beta-curcumene synthase
MTDVAGQRAVTTCLSMEQLSLPRMLEPLHVALRELWALRRTVGRWLLWGRPAVSREMAIWRSQAETIPDRSLREYALDSIVDKRDLIEGAALFSVLPKRRNPQLLRLLVAYQTLWNYLDSATERDAREAHSGLHMALKAALDPDSPMPEYFHHSRNSDGGYLHGLVKACRVGCLALPSYSRVRQPMLAAVAQCALIQGLNHHPDPACRDAALNAWAEMHCAGERELAWFESTAAASGCLPHALLAMAAEGPYPVDDIPRTQKLYLRLAALLTTMLDGYVDQIEDERSGDHCYVAHYDDADLALERLREVIGQTMHETRALPDGARHTTLIACMIAMQLSDDRAYAPGMRLRTQTLVNAGGLITRLLYPLARMWRVAYLDRASIDGRGQTLNAARAGLPSGPRLPAAVEAVAIWKSPLTHLERCRARYGSRFTIKITSHPPLVFLCDPDDIKAVLSAPAEALHPGEGSNTIEPLVGRESFMLHDEDVHLEGRKIILPPLRAEAVSQQTKLADDVSRRAIALWPRDVPIALHSRLRELTLETALRTALGISADVSDPRLQELHRRLLSMLSVTGYALFSEPLLRHGLGQRRWRRFLREKAEVDDLLYDIINRRDRPRHRASALLDRLLDAQNADGSLMSAQQVRDNLMSILVAGHETTAAQLAWTFQLLAHNPAVLEKLIGEIDSGASEQLPHSNNLRGATSPAGIPVRDPTSSQATNRHRRLDLPSASPLAGLHISPAPHPGAIPRT